MVPSNTTSALATISAMQGSRRRRTSKSEDGFQKRSDASRPATNEGDEDGVGSAEGTDVGRAVSAGVVLATRVAEGWGEGVSLSAVRVGSRIDSGAKVGSELWGFSE